jgi:Na+/glutamate symporter
MLFIPNSLTADVIIMYNITSMILYYRLNEDLDAIFFIQYLFINILLTFIGLSLHIPSQRKLASS